MGFDAPATPRPSFEAAATGGTKPPQPPGKNRKPTTERNRRGAAPRGPRPAPAGPRGRRRAAAAPCKNRRRWTILIRPGWPGPAGPAGRPERSGRPEMPSGGRAGRRAGWGGAPPAARIWGIVAVVVAIEQVRRSDRTGAAGPSAGVPFVPNDSLHNLVTSFADGGYSSEHDRRSACHAEFSQRSNLN